MAQEYFNQLNYTLGNEDTSIDVEIVKRLGSQSIFSVAGCGSRSFPLLSQCEELHLCDVSFYQLALCRLRESLYRDLEYEEYLMFFDFPPYDKDNNNSFRKNVFKRINLRTDDREFFNKLFEEINWSSLLYVGKWERTFSLMSKVVRVLMGKNYNEIFKFYDLEDQKSYFYSTFNKWRWKSILFLLGNKSVFNALLYKGDFIEKNINQSHFEFYKTSFEKLFVNNLARESFFSHLCFFGKITHEDGNTIEAKAENYASVKSSMNKGAEIEYHQSDMISLLESQTFKNRFDYIGPSDVPSYFTGDLEVNFLQRIKNSLKDKGVVCLRNYLRIPNCEEEGFLDITDDFKDLYPLEKVGVYHFKVYQKR